MANITINKIKQDEAGLSRRIKIRVVRGENFWIARPMAKGTIKEMANIVMFSYGTRILPLANIMLPNVKIHKGIIPKAAKLLSVVINIDRLMLPPNMTAHMFDAPPLGETPVKNRPNCISTEFGNIR